MKKKRGEILLENVIFIILNLLFFTILVLFLIKQGQGVVLMEQTTAKQIALLIDAAPDNSMIKINLEKAKQIAEKNEIAFEDIIKIQGNNVIVKLSSESSSSYSFFRNLGFDNRVYSDGDYYVFTIKGDLQ